MKKMLTAFFAAGMLAVTLGAAEKQIYQADFTKNAVAYAQFAKNCKFERANALTAEILVTDKSPTSVQIGATVPAGLAPGNYRMDCTITVSQDAKYKVSIFRSSPPWSGLAGKDITFKANEPTNVSIPLTIKAKTDYPIRLAGMGIGHAPVGTKVTINSAKLFQITE